MEEYTTKTDVENYLNKTIDDSLDVTLTDWIIAMSSYIDSQCNRNIAKVPAEGDDKIETFKYDGDGTDTLLIKDCCNITNVKIDDVVTEVYKYPANKSYTNKLKLSELTFTKGLQNVEVTGIQAMFDEVPKDIAFACTVLVGGICNNQIYKEKGTSEKIGQYTITYGDSQKADIDRMKSILSSYKRISF